MLSGPTAYVSEKGQKEGHPRGSGWPAEGSGDGDPGGWGEGSFLIGPVGTKPMLLMKGDPSAVANSISATGG